MAAPVLKFLPMALLLLGGCQFEKYVDHAAKIAVTNVVVDPSELTLEVGADPVQLGLSVSPSDATDTSVVWSSTVPSAATVSASGLVTPQAEGTTQIRATSKDDSTKSSVCTVTVVAAAVHAVTSVTLSPTSWSATALNQTLQLTAEVLPTNASNKSLTWTSSDSQRVSVSSSGLLTVHDDGGTQPYIITATSNSDGTKKATCQVYVAFP